MGKRKSKKSSKKGTQPSRATRHAVPPIQAFGEQNAPAVQAPGVQGPAPFPPRPTRSQRLTAPPPVIESTLFEPEPAGPGYAHPAPALPARSSTPAPAQPWRYNEPVHGQPPYHSTPAPALPTRSSTPAPAQPWRYNEPVPGQPAHHGEPAPAPPLHYSEHVLPAHPARYSGPAPARSRRQVPASWSSTNLRSAQPLQAPELPARPAAAGEGQVETNLSRVFETLAAILVPYARSMESEMHPKIGFCLKIPATGPAGKEMHFGGVQLYDDGVAFHLFPLYSHPDLLKGVSVPLVNCMRGQTCFFIEALAPGHADELRALTHASFERFRSDGLV